MEEYKLDEWQSTRLKEREVANAALEIEAGVLEEDPKPVEVVVEEVRLNTDDGVGPLTSSVGSVDNKHPEPETSSRKTEPLTLSTSESVTIGATFAADADTPRNSHSPITLPSTTYLPLEAEVEDIVDQIMGGGSAYASFSKGKCKCTGQASHSVFLTSPVADGDVPQGGASTLDIPPVSPSSEAFETLIMTTSEISSIASTNVEETRSIRTTTTTESTISRPARSSTPHSPSPSSSTGESVYRNIMKRIIALESNGSLSVKYIEDQTRSVRGALKRLEGDIVRLQTSVRSISVSCPVVVSSFDFRQHRLALQKASIEVQNQKREIELQRMEFMMQLHSLSNEVKRRLYIK